MCGDCVLPIPDSTSSPGRGREVRSWIGWTPLVKTERSRVWLVQVALQGEAVFSALSAADWVKKGSYHTMWAVPPLSSCLCSLSFGKGAAVGPQTGRRCWPLLSRLWRDIAPLMKRSRTETDKRYVPLD